MPDTTVKKISVNKILVSNETPATTIAGKLWLNPSETPRPRLYEYNGTTWVRCGDTVTIDGVTLTIEQVVENLGTYIDTSLNKKVDWNILESNEIILKQGCDITQQTYSHTNICSIDLAKPYSYCFNYRMNFKSNGDYGDTIFGNYNSTAGWKIYYSLDTNSSEYVYNVYFKYVDQDSSKSISSTLIDFPCTDDELHTLVVAYTGSEFKIYIDGILKNTFATTATSYNVTPIIYRMGDYYTERNLKNIYVFNFDITDASAPYTLTDYLNGNVIPTNLLGGTFYTTKPSMGLDDTSDWNITSALTVDRQQGGWLCKAGVAYCKQRSVADLPTGVEKALDLNTTTSASYYLSDTTDKIDHLADKNVRVKISFWARKNSTDKSYSTHLYIYAGGNSLYAVSGSAVKDNNWHKYETTRNASISSYNINRGINIKAYAKANTFTDYAWSIADLHVELIGAAVALENYVYREDVDYYTNCPLLKDASANGNNYYYYYSSEGDYADNSILVDHPEIKPGLIKLIDINSFLPKNYSEAISTGYKINKINGSLAEGYETVVNNDNSNHAEGYGTRATGYAGAHAEGYSTTSSGYSTHAEGYYTRAASEYQHVQGKYNAVDNNNIYADIIGGGSSDSDRKNIYTVDWNGNVVAEGDVSGKVDGNVVSLSSLSADISTKATDSAVVHLAGTETITGAKTFSDGMSNSTTVYSSGVSVTGSGYTTSLDYQGINFNTGRLEGILSDFTSRSSTTVVNAEATYNELELKQNKTDNTLTTSSKTIVGAINELVGTDHNINEVLIEHDNTLTAHTGQITKAEDDIASINTKLLANVPAPITNVFTSTSTSLIPIITDSAKANIQGKILISPNINNLGAVYVGQSITDKSTAFPLYPNQIVSFSFTDITDFKVATDVIGDKFNYVIEFGILNAAVTPAEGLIIVGTDGSKYRLNPSGDTGSETFTLTKIS